MKKTIVTILLLFAVVALPAPARQISKAEFIKELNVLFLKEDYQALIRSSQNNLPQYRLSRREKKEVLSLTGIAEIKTAAFDAARNTFHDILKMKGSEYREEAHIGIADAYFYEGNIDRAIKAYEETLTMYPRSDRLPGIYYNLGQAYQAKKEPEKANYYLRMVKDSYDGSFESGTVACVPVERKPDYYIIQLGAFRSMRNAKKLLRRLSRKGYDSYIQKVKKSGSTLYRVRGGKFSNKSYASRLAKKLTKDGFLVKIIEE